MNIKDVAPFRIVRLRFLPESGSAVHGQASAEYRQGEFAGKNPAKVAQNPVEAGEFVRPNRMPGSRARNQSGHIPSAG